MIDKKVDTELMNEVQFFEPIYDKYYPLSYTTR